MIKSFTITFNRDFPNPEAWSMHIECQNQQGMEMVEDVISKNGSRSSDFEASGPLHKAIAFIPRAFKAMGIEEALDEIGYPTQNLTKSTSEEIKTALKEDAIEEYKASQERSNDDLIRKLYPKG